MPAAQPAKKEAQKTKPLPAPNGDFYQLADLLTAEEKAIVKKVRAYMETKVAPIINKYWIPPQPPASSTNFEIACFET